MFNYRRKPGFA